MAKRFSLEVPNKISVSLETNGKGFLGFLVELPGAFVRGESETEVLSKVDSEVRSYLRWLSISPPGKIDSRIVERHFCELTVEDADGAYNNSKAYSANETNTLAFPAYKRLSFSVGTLDSYLNDPPVSLPPTKPNSLQFTMGISYAIKSKY